MNLVQLHQRKRSKKSKSDQWWTPKWLFDCLCAIYDFDPILDVCASYKSTMCDYYLSEQENSLNQQWWYGKRVKRRSRKTGEPISYEFKWFGEVEDIVKNVCVWCNPPNSELGEYLRRAYKEFKERGIKTMMIVPTNSMSSKAFWDAVETPRREGEKVMYDPIYKRIPFLDNGKKPKFSARNAYIVIIWGRKSRF